MVNITFSRIFFGICTSATVNFSLKRSVSSWALPWAGRRAVLHFLSFDHDIPDVDIPTCDPQLASQTIPAEPAQYRLEDTFKNFSKKHEKCGSMEAKIEGDWFSKSVNTRSLMNEFGSKLT